MAVGDYGLRDGKIISFCNHSQKYVELLRCGNSCFNNSNRKQPWTYVGGPWWEGTKALEMRKLLARNPAEGLGG